MKIIVSVPCSDKEKMYRAGVRFKEEGKFLLVPLEQVYEAFVIPDVFLSGMLQRTTFFIKEYERVSDEFSHIVCGAFSGKALPCKRVFFEKKHALFLVKNSLATVTVFKKTILLQRHCVEVFGDRAWISSKNLWSGKITLPPSFAMFYAAQDAAVRKAKEGKSEVYFGVVRR